MDGPSQMSCCGMASPDQQGGIRSQDVSKSVFSDILGMACSLGAGAALNRAPPKNPLILGQHASNDAWNEAGNALVAPRKGERWYVSATPVLTGKDCLQRRISPKVRGLLPTSE